MHTSIPPTTPQPTDSKPAGQFNRQINLQRHDEYTVTGWLEDDFHHFGLTLTHADGLITDISTRAVRFPWSTCDNAGALLQALPGKPLSPRSTDIGALLDMRLQCTHLFDLCGLVMAHACKAIEQRRYHAIIDDREVVGYKGNLPIMGQSRARLLQDGQQVVDWLIDGSKITAGTHGQQHMGKGFRAWTESMELEQGEQATVLRRAILVSGGRTVDHDQYATAAATGNPALCYSYQPEHSQQARRQADQTRDFSGRSELMLIDISGPLVTALP